MPYVGAFATHTEKLLFPHLAKIKETEKELQNAKWRKAPSEQEGIFPLLFIHCQKLRYAIFFTMRMMISPLR